MLRFFMSLVLVLAAWMGAYVIEGGNLLALLGFSGFLITFFVPLFAVLAVWSGKNLGQAWHRAFHPAPAAEASASSELWKFAEAACYIGGFLAFFAGAVLILGNLEGADGVHIGHAVAALLVAPTYSTFFGLICRILRARVEVGSTRD